MNFATEVDIANRACDYCGVASIDPAQGFNENSRQAAIFGRIYDKLRAAELRRANWIFSITQAVLRPISTTTMLLQASLWAIGTTYFVGSIVADGDGRLWVSNTADNLGNEPGNSLNWAQYCGPLTVNLYNSTSSYFAGELVYTAAGDGTNRTFMSLISGNSDNPATATAWDATVTYYKDQVVTYLGTPYLSPIDLNANNQPSLSPAPWSAGTTYAINNTVGGSDGAIYRSLSNGNIGFDPTTDLGVHWLNTGVLTPWTAAFVGGRGSLNWRQIGGAEFPAGVNLTTMNIIYPLGAGPAEQSISRNAYRLPAGHLRKAPQDPKAGSASMFGAPTNLVYDDWNFQGNFITSRQSDAIPYRFVADFVNVADMDDMFCEGLALRMALAAVIPLTQSQDTAKLIAGEYTKFMGEGRLANSIEAGSEESALDDLIACRA